MLTTHLRRLGLSLAAAVAATFVAACAVDSPLTPARASAARGGIAAATSDIDAGIATDAAACSIAAPEGSKLIFRAYADGFQIYRWDGASWQFVAPSATLYADPQKASIVGSHSAGPTWTTVSGASIVATVSKRCTPDASAIPWLLLVKVSTTGPGLFDQVTSIQRANTVGGVAPSYAGSVVGELANVPYEAQYLFYRAE